MFAEVDHPDFVPNAVAGEVNYDVIPLCDALLIKLGERNGAGEQVAVIGNLDHGRTIAQRDLEEAGNAGIQDAEAVLATLDFEVRLVGQVHRHYVTEEPVEVKDVEEQLSALVERLVGQHQVHVVIQVAPALCCTGG